MTTALPLSSRLWKSRTSSAPLHQNLARVQYQNLDTIATHKLVYLPSEATNGAKDFGTLKKPEDFNKLSAQLAQNKDRMFTGKMKVASNPQTLGEAGGKQVRVPMTYVPRGWVQGSNGVYGPPPPGTGLRYHLFEG